MICVVSLAVPVNAGVTLLDRVGGEFNVTVGGAVSTLNVTGALTPAGFPSELACVAVALYVFVPLDRAGVALPEVQLPVCGVAVALETSWFAELYIWTMTGVVSLAVPVNDGVTLFDGDAGWRSVTVGGAVSTAKVTGLLVPAGLPSELGCVAIAVYCPLASTGLALPEVQLPPVPAAVAVETTEPPTLDPA